jgi:hypothetical protein
MRPILFVACIIALTCQVHKEAAGQEPENNSNAKNAASGSFLDSVAKKNHLSIEQIKCNTSIDSVFYTDVFSHARFTGDTVVPLSGGLTGAIIEYGNGLSCFYKFMLVFSFPDKRNTAYIEIYSDCDRDASAAYTYLRYKLVNDSTFETTEFYIPANWNKVKSEEKRKYGISGSGTIYSLD